MAQEPKSDSSDDTSPNSGGTNSTTAKSDWRDYLSWRSAGVMIAILLIILALGYALLSCFGCMGGGTSRTTITASSVQSPSGQLIAPLPPIPPPAAVSYVPATDADVPEWLKPLPEESAEPANAVPAPAPAPAPITPQEQAAAEPPASVPVVVTPPTTGTVLCTDFIESTLGNVVTVRVNSNDWLVSGAECDKQNRAIWRNSLLAPSCFTSLHEGVRNDSTGNYDFPETPTCPFRECWPLLKAQPGSRKVADTCRPPG